MSLILTIENIVATCNLNAVLDLIYLAQNLWNIEFNPKNFNGAVVKFRNPSATILLFRTGKTVITGVRNKTDLKKVRKKLIKKVKFLLGAIEPSNPSIQNITSSTDIGQKIKLHNIYYKYPRSCIYEPEEFPGLKFYTKNKGPLFIVFNSGKVIMTGVKKFKEMDDEFIEFYWRIIYPELY